MVRFMVIEGVEGNSIWLQIAKSYTTWLQKIESPAYIYIASLFLRTQNPKLQDWEDWEDCILQVHLIQIPVLCTEI